MVTQHSMKSGVAWHARQTSVTCALCLTVMITCSSHSGKNFEQEWELHVIVTVRRNAALWSHNTPWRALLRDMQDKLVSLVHFNNWILKVTCPMSFHSCRDISCQVWSSLWQLVLKHFGPAFKVWCIYHSFPTGTQDHLYNDLSAPTQAVYSANSCRLVPTLLWLISNQNLAWAFASARNLSCHHDAIKLRHVTWQRVSKNCVLGRLDSSCKRYLFPVV